MISEMLIGKTVKSVDVSPEWGDDFDLKLTLEDGSVIRIFGTDYFSAGLTLNYKPGKRVEEIPPSIPREYHPQHS